MAWFNSKNTAQNGLLEDLGKMSKQHELGTIDASIPEEKHQGDSQAIAKLVNGMVSAQVDDMQKIMACLAEFGKGNFDAPIQQFPGAKGHINETIEQIRHNFKAVISDTNLLTQAATEGKLSTRADAGKLQGIHDPVWGSTTSAMISVARCSADMYRSVRATSPPKITDIYNGDFNEIKNNLNVLYRGHERTAG